MNSGPSILLTVTFRIERMSGVVQLFQWRRLVSCRTIFYPSRPPKSRAPSGDSSSVPPSGLPRCRRSLRALLTRFNDTAFMFGTGNQQHGEPIRRRRRLWSPFGFPSGRATFLRVERRATDGAISAGCDSR